MTTLFKKDSKGKLRVLNIYTEGPELIQTAGLHGGALVENRKVCTPKNVGKANEVSAEDQALSEMASKIAEKLKEDYFTTLEEAADAEVILPMLAKSYKDHAHKIDWDTDVVATQPKLDGMRALGVTGPNASLTSRTGTPIDTMPHIIEELKRFPEGQILDGELYAHGLSFQENMTLIKKNRGIQSEQVKFHVYDMVSNRPFEERYQNVQLLFADANPDCMQVVSTIFIDKTQLGPVHTQNLNAGYEGTMIRWGRDGYKVNGRSENLLKHKDFIDIQLPILDIIPSEARPEWGQPIYRWEGARGHSMGDDILGSGMKFSHAERKEWLINKHKYIGKIAELRFFEYSDTGVPRFPVTVGIRLDK